MLRVSSLALPLLFPISHELFWLALMFSIFFLASFYFKNEWDLECGPFAIWHQAADETLVKIFQKNKMNAERGKGEDGRDWNSRHPRISLIRNVVLRMHSLRRSFSYYAIIGQLTGHGYISCIHATAISFYS